MTTTAQTSRLSWPGIPKAAVLMLALAALMCLDVWLTHDQITVKPAVKITTIEANQLAFYMGPGLLLALKLVVAVILGAYSVWRRSLKGLVVGCVLMALVLVWNLVMLVVF